MLQTDWNFPNAQPDPVQAAAAMQKNLQAQAKQWIDSAWFRPTPQVAAQPQGQGQNYNQNRNYSQGALSRFNSNVPRSLIGSESGGNWFAYNDEIGHGGAKGHDGILQFGEARLTDAKRAGIIPANMTRQQFRQNIDAQIAVSNWHFDDIDKNIRARGFDGYVGQTIGGVPITWDGMRSMAHLGGFGGLSRFLTSGGQYNPSDSFGTSLAAYGKRHQG